MVVRARNLSNNKRHYERVSAISETMIHNLLEIYTSICYDELDDIFLLYNNTIQIIYYCNGLKARVILNCKLASKS